MIHDNISLELPAKSEYVSIARLTASVIANRIGFDVEEIEDIKVAVGEACNNAVIHGNNLDAKFNIEFTVSEDSLKIEITDRGEGFSFEDYKEPDLENPKENGLGIFIMKTLMDDVTIDIGDGNGTKITLIKNM
jgi:serine/threonine-protein kinase RsbW